MNKPKFRAFLKRQLLKMKFMLLSVVEDARKSQQKKDNDKLESGFALSGSDVSLKGKITVTHPKMIIIGQNVHIDEGAFFDTIGGLIIGDNVHISKNVSIVTSYPNLNGDLLPYDEKYVVDPVIIKENSWIGMNVIIKPGVTIGKGASVNIGTIVTEDVPDNSTIGFKQSEKAVNRNTDVYSELNKQLKFSNEKGLPYSNYSNYENGHEIEDRMFFILSTGRSGSKSIASLLNEHSDINCGHEFSPFLIKLSTDYAYKRYPKEYFLSVLDEIYGLSKRIPKGSYFGESNQKLVALAPLLHQLFPKAKFIWLNRNGKDVVSSTYGRDWYSTKSADSELFNPNLRTWDNYRIEGDKVGEFTPEQWNKYSVFEKNCWYWKYWNSLIENFFADLPDNQKLVIKLEDLGTEVGRIKSFLNLKDENIKMEVTNKAYYPVKKYDDWEEDKKEAFSQICGPSMKKWGYK